MSLENAQETTVKTWDDYREQDELYEIINQYDNLTVSEKEAKYPLREGNLIVKQLYLGNVQCSRNKAWLDAVGITHILVAGITISESLSMDIYPYVCTIIHLLMIGEDLGCYFPGNFSYHVLYDLWDQDEAPILLHFKASYEFIADALRQGLMHVICDFTPPAPASHRSKYLFNDPLRDC